jgi:hypothetical protein
MRSAVLAGVSAVTLHGVFCAAAPAAVSPASRVCDLETACPTAPGFRGIWYNVGRKYSGGLGTYPQIILPMACYSRTANKTFFVYGGVNERGKLQNLISYYDHATGKLARPRVVRDTDTGDAHDNPSLSIDDGGLIWVFCNVHGNANRRSLMYKSTQPYSIDSLREVELPESVFPEHRFNYAQPWHVPGRGLLLLHTRYTNGRQLYMTTTVDGGLTWSARKQLTELPGHYQISWRRGWKVATAFNRHPGRDVDKRTDLYYMYTEDMGESWHTADGTPIPTPLGQIDNPALVHKYSDEGRLVYLKDLNFDADGNPVILYLTSNGYRPGPESDPRTWQIAHWTGSRWRLLEVTGSDHNYDFGSVYIEADGTWRVIGPTQRGPQPYGTGGEVVMWTSSDRGETWQKKQITRESRYNHSYVRRPLDAHPEFYAFWADGNPLERSESRLYFTGRAGEKVWRMPYTMRDDVAAPEVAW